MAKARITREKYEELVAYYTKNPGKARGAVLACNVSSSTTVRAWRVGWDEPAWALAINEEIAARKKQAREAGEQQAIADGKAEELKKQKAIEEGVRDEMIRRDRVKLDAIEERSREAQGVKAAISTALLALGNVGLLSKASTELVRYASQLIHEGIMNRTLDLDLAMRTLEKIIRVGGQAVDILAGAQQAYRLHVGEPNQIIGHAPDYMAWVIDDEEMLLKDFSPEDLKQIGDDIAEGKNTPNVIRLVEWQANMAERARIGRAG